MSGGKETPRQKMIGMMYLVLTALLALNVSKAILDAFVAIEENTQKAALTNYERGKNAKDQIVAEKAGDASNIEKLKKIDYCLTIIDKIDKSTESMIKEIDAIKLDILTKSGEEVTKTVMNDKEVIYWKKGEKCIPARLNLMAVNGKDQYDVPMHEIIGEDLKTPTGSGLKLWNNYNKFRLDITGLMSTWEFGGQKFGFKPKAINKFKDNADLTKQIDAMFAKAGASVNKDDKEAIAQVYAELTKNERVDSGEETGLHWIGKTFDHSPIVAAIASLTAMQQEVLGARASAIALVKSKVSTGEYSFNKIMALAYGPVSVNANEDFEVKVMMAAYDSDNNPEVPGASEIKDGVAIVKGKGSGSEVNMSGTVSIRKKDGSKKTENWSTTVRVMKPEGTVSLPDMNMVYRGYDNKVVGVASGYESTSLSGNGIALSKSGAFYIGKPGPGKTCTISISGKSGDKSANLGTFTFRVSGLPPATVSFAGIGNGDSAPLSTIKAGTRLFAGYPPEIPLNVKFNVTAWTMTVQGAPRPISGSGNTLSGEAIALLKQARPNSTVSFMTTVTGGGMSRKGACVVGVK